MPTAIVKTLCLVSLIVASATVFGGDEPEQDDIEFFEKRVRPVLIDHCYRCHSEKAEKLEGDLRVDSREGLLQGGNQGPAIEPGEPDRSLLIKAVKYDMDDLKMPPDRRLEDKQIADLEKWIKSGAPFPKKSRDRSVGSVRSVRSVIPHNPSIPQGAFSPFSR